MGRKTTEIPMECKVVLVCHIICLEDDNILTLADIRSLSTASLQQMHTEASTTALVK